MSETADCVEQFASRFIPFVKLVTARLVSAQRWAEIDPYHIDAVATRTEIADIDPELTEMLNDLVKITMGRMPYLQREASNAAPDDLADEQRIATALREMTAVIKECTEQEQRYAALPNCVESGSKTSTGSFL